MLRLKFWVYLSEFKWIINRPFAHLSNYYHIGNFSKLWEKKTAISRKKQMGQLSFCFQLYLYPLMKNVKNNNKKWHLTRTWSQQGQKELLNFGLTGKLRGPWVNLFEKTIPKWKWKLKRKKYIPSFPGKGRMGRRHKFFSLFFLFWVRIDHLST